MLILLIILGLVITLGLSLRSLQVYRPFDEPDGFLSALEGFQDTQIQRTYDNGHMTGYEISLNGDQTDLFRPEDGPIHSQLENVPSAKEYVIGRIKKYESHVPLKHSDREYTFGTMDDEIIQKFARGTNPEIVLNPDSHIEDQITCDLEQDCDEYVRNSNLYCPMGMDRLRLKESTGTPNEEKYQGCYTITRDYPLLACRFGDRFNYCNYMTDLRIQRVGRGFYVLPTYEVLKDAMDRAETDLDKRKISHILNTKIYMIRHMILTYDHEEVKRHFKKIQKWTPWSGTGSPMVDQYARQIFYNTFILYQSKTTGTPTRLGFIMRTDTPTYVPKGTIPELSTPSTRHSYDLKNVKFVHDTTKDPMPVLQPRIHKPKTRNGNLIAGNQ